MTCNASTPVRSHLHTRWWLLHYCSPSQCIKMLASALRGSKPRSFKKAMTFWFYRLLDCFSLYILHKSWHTKPARMDLKVSMPEGNLMNIGRSLLLSKLSRYAPTMFICSTMKPKRYALARNMRSDSRLTVGENVSLKETPCSCEKPCATSRAF